MTKGNLRQRLLLTPIILALGVSFAASGAQAISRYNSTSLTCASIKSKISSEGAVILRWQSPRNPGNTLFGRYVANDNYCDLNKVTETAYVPAADRRSCSVYLCKPPSLKNDLFERFRRF